MPPAVGLVALAVLGLSACTCLVQGHGAHAVVSVPAPAAAAAASGALVRLDVDWASFLARHEMTWKWTWEVGGVFMLQPTANDLARCGPRNTTGLCCFQAGCVP